ncbi:DUF6777 domain-containing protein [Streptomyces sp. NPDC001536]|uniref:DUF6777 domain-containing protein n=1 Tax=Streptomyces sp. NPDC001536 TaxID=3364583 RepID=UPI003689E31E
MRPSTGTFVTACALATALIVVGCVGSGDENTNSSGELFLQPVAAQGPDPFTDSTATPTATPSPVTRTQQPAQPGVRSISGGTPGLYGGTVGSGSCDVNRQIGHLTADPAKGRAFARVEGISQGSIPSYLRSLTSVVLRADTRVTNHGYRDGRTTTYQSVLQSGTAVLVDARGVPRVRCACGNPLTPARESSGATTTSGRAWPGYRHAQVVVVAPAPRAVTHITIINIVDNTWIERRCGHDTRYDHVVPRPEPLAPASTHPPSPSRSESGVSPSAGLSASPSTGNSVPEVPELPERPTTDCVTPTVTVTPGVPTTPGVPVTEDPACPAATATATPPTATVPDGPTIEDPSVTEEETGAETGPETVPDTPDVPDGGGLIPDSPDEPTTTDSIFDSPTAVLES